MVADLGESKDPGKVLYCTWALRWSGGKGSRSLSSDLPGLPLCRKDVEHPRNAPHVTGKIAEEEIFCAKVPSAQERAGSGINGRRDGRDHEWLLLMGSQVYGQAVHDQLEKPGRSQETHAGHVHEPVNEGKPASERVHTGQHDDPAGQKGDHGKYKMPGEKCIEVLPFALGNVHVQPWRHGIEPGIGHAEHPHPQGDAETNFPGLDRTVELEHQWRVYLKDKISGGPTEGILPQQAEELFFPGVRVSPGHSDQIEEESAVASQDDTRGKERTPQNGNRKREQSPSETEETP